jgi:hypothetical protein
MSDFDEMFDKAARATRKIQEARIAALQCLEREWPGENGLAIFADVEQAQRRVNDATAMLRTALDAFASTEWPRSGPGGHYVRAGARPARGITGAKP